YPDSVTYVQIYMGEPELGRVGTVIVSSVVYFNTYAPQNAVVPLTVPDAALGTDGTYTSEVLTVTPFDTHVPERVAHVSLQLDRTIQVRGNLANSAAN